jgi:hypothetical protein
LLVIFLPKKAYHTAVGKVKQLSLEEKTKIMCWAAEGVKTKHITTRLGRSERAIRMHLSVLKSLLPNAMLPLLKVRSRSSSKTNFLQELRLKKYVKKFPFKSSRELKNEVQGWRDVSVTTIQEWLQKKMGLPEAPSDRGNEAEAAGFCQKVLELDCRSLEKRNVQ